VRGWFKRRPVVRVQQLTLEQIADLRVASAWDMTEADWNSLTDFERRECRRLITTAPRFQP
jgi:hypothetical protein